MVIIGAERGTRPRRATIEEGNMLLKAMERVVRGAASWVATELVRVPVLSGESGELPAEWVGSEVLLLG